MIIYVCGLCLFVLEATSVLNSKYIIAKGRCIEMKVVLKAFLFIICILVIVSCSKKDPNIVKIAVAGPMTGDNAEYGIGFKNAVELMAKKWNRNGGVLGKKIIIESYDDKNTGEEAATVAEKIGSDVNILAVVGHFSSGVCMAASPTYQEYGIIEISPSAGHPDYTKEGDYIFRNNVIINAEAAEAVKLAKDVLGKKKIGVLSVRTDWGTLTSKILIDIIKKTDATLTKHEEVIEGTDDYSPNITMLNNTGTEVVIVAGMYNTLAPFARQYRDINPDVEFVGFSNAYSEELIKLGRESIENVHIPTIFFHTKNEKNIKEFVTNYNKEYNSVPSSLTAQAYDSAGIILEGIKKANSTDREKVKDAILSINYKGVTGNTIFNEIGDAKKTFTHAKVKNGSFVEIAGSV